MNEDLPVLPQILKHLDCSKAADLPLPPICCQGDVWICMELMDTSLDKFYKQVIEKGLTIPEDILGKIAVSVGSFQQQHMKTCSRYLLRNTCLLISCLCYYR